MSFLQVISGNPFSSSLLDPRVKSEDDELLLSKQTLFKSILEIVDLRRMNLNSGTILLRYMATVNWKRAKFVNGITRYDKIFHFY